MPVVWRVGLATSAATPAQQLRSLSSSAVVLPNRGADSTGGPGISTSSDVGSRSRGSWGTTVHGARRRRCVPELSARGERRGAGLRTGHLGSGIDRIFGLRSQVRFAPGDSSLETIRPSQDLSGPPRRWEHRLGGRRYRMFEECRRLTDDAVSQGVAMHHVLPIGGLCARRSLALSRVVQHPHVFPSGWSPRLGGHTETTVVGRLPKVSTLRRTVRIPQVSAETLATRGATCGLSVVSYR